MCQSLFISMRGIWISNLSQCPLYLVVHSCLPYCFINDENITLNTFSFKVNRLEGNFYDPFFCACFNFTFDAKAV